MAHKTLIGGIAYEIKGGRDLIGGTGYAKKKGRVLVNGTGYDIPFSSGIPIGTLAVGSTVKIGVNGKSYDFLVVNQGIPSNSNLYDSSCDGTWLLMKDIYENRVWSSSNVNKYESSSINSYLNSTFLNLIDSSVKGAIKQVKIPYRKGGGGGTVQSGANGLSCKVFLLSGYELGWTTDYNPYFPVDGAKLDYFPVNYDGKPKRIAYLNGNVTNWWTRSPSAYNNTNKAFNITNNGDSDMFIDVSNPLGSRPAFTLPSTFPLIQNTDGSYSPAA